MPQFAVHRNRNAATRARYPLLLDVQSDLLAGIGTRVVIPLVAFSSLGDGALTTLTPALTIEGAALCCPDAAAGGNRCQ